MDIKTSVQYFQKSLKTKNLVTTKEYVSRNSAIVIQIVKLMKYKIQTGMYLKKTKTVNLGKF